MIDSVIQSEGRTRSISRQGQLIMRERSKRNMRENIDRRRLELYQTNVIKRKILLQT